MKRVHTNKIDKTIDSLSTDTTTIKKIDAEDTKDILNWKVIVSPPFCGKSYLVLDQLQLTCLDNPEQQIRKNI